MGNFGRACERQQGQTGENADPGPQEGEDRPAQENQQIQVSDGPAGNSVDTDNFRKGVQPVIERSKGQCRKKVGNILPRRHRIPVPSPDRRGHAELPIHDTVVGEMPVAGMHVERPSRSASGKTTSSVPEGRQRRQRPPSLREQRPPARRRSVPAAWGLPPTCLTAPEERPYCPPAFSITMRRGSGGVFAVRVVCEFLACVSAE
ncbi:hypothetical protein C882_3334 [Caenispirillum salinarum AK4]|uniref:Uncharacterized protein n=1 Tax=Caenispirillum salinarum AK4 TaxID=1238182 RepID=K9GLX2_9PROT|nr:hypothetical protein C882_3334 [Caenispirillum salinarum AK4]